MDLFYLFLSCVLLLASVGAAPQVPYDYVPIGRENRRSDGNAGHPHDVNLNYERLFPARRKYIDSPSVRVDPDLDFFKNPFTPAFLQRRRSINVYAVQTSFPIGAIGRLRDNSNNVTYASNCYRTPTLKKR